MHGSGWMFNGFGVGMWLWPLILVGAVAFAVYLLTTRAAAGRTPRDLPGEVTGHSATETPLEILKKRYAKGELTDDEYEHMRTMLQKE